jgi:hypothetical protein
VDTAIQGDTIQGEVTPCGYFAFVKKSHFLSEFNARTHLEISTPAASLEIEQGMWEECGSSDDDDRYFRTSSRKRASPPNKLSLPASAKNDRRSCEGIADANMFTSSVRGSANGVGAEVEAEVLFAPQDATSIVVSALVESVARSIAAAHLQ